MYWATFCLSVHNLIVCVEHFSCLGNHNTQHTSVSVRLGSWARRDCYPTSLLELEVDDIFVMHCTSALECVLLYDTFDSCVSDATHTSMCAPAVVCTVVMTLQFDFQLEHYIYIPAAGIHSKDMY